MTKILPRRHLCFVQKIATSSHDTLKQFRDANLALSRILISSDILCHLLRHILDDFRCYHHITTIKYTTVVRDLRQVATYAQYHVTIGDSTLQWREPKRSTLAQIRCVAMPTGRFFTGETSPTCQTVSTTGTTLYSDVTCSCCIPPEISRCYRWTHLSTVLVPLTIRTRLRVRDCRHWNWTRVKWLFLQEIVPSWMLRWMGDDPIRFSTILLSNLKRLNGEGISWCWEIVLMIFASSLKKLCFCEKMCVCMFVCARLPNFQTTIIHKWPEISSWNLVQQWSSHASSIVTIFMQIDAQSKILWDFEFFEKCLW